MALKSLAEGIFVLIEQGTTNRYNTVTNYLSLIEKLCCQLGQVLETAKAKAKVKV